MNTVGEGLAVEPPHIDPMTATDVPAFMRCLWLLRIRAGNPSLGTLARRTGLPKSTLHDGLSLKRTKLPPLGLVRSVVGVLAGAEAAVWEAAWYGLATEHAAATSPSVLSPPPERPPEGRDD